MNQKATQRGATFYGGPLDGARMDVPVGTRFQHEFIAGATVRTHEWMVVSERKAIYLGVQSVRPLPPRE